MLDAIVIDSRPDTSFYTNIISGVETNLIVNPSGHQIKELLRGSSNDLLLFGHGSELGLFNQHWNGYCIDRSHLEMLRKRRIIGVWCYAGNFADRYRLHGFFTSMFISNSREACEYGFDTTEDEVNLQNTIFGDALNRLILDGTPMEQWVDILQSQCDSNIPFVRFNYEAMAYFE